MLGRSARALCATGSISGPKQQGFFWSVAALGASQLYKFCNFGLLTLRLYVGYYHPPFWDIIIPI